MVPQILSSFFISAGGDPEECTREIGLAPSFTKRRGFAPSPSHPPARENHWSINTGWMELYSTDESLRLLLQIVWPVRDKVRAYCEHHGGKVGFVVAVEIRDDRPIYELSKESISMIASLDAECGFDIYDRSSDPSAQ